MAQTNLNFNDQPAAKVGKIGEEIVKAFLQNDGIRVLPPPDIAASGASRVDFLVIRPNGDKALVEVKTWRQRVRDGQRVFVMEKAKFEAYEAYSAEKRLPLNFYLVDVSSEFDIGSDDKPCIRWATLSLLEIWKKNSKTGVEDGVPCIYFEVAKFVECSFLAEEETRRLVAAIREMDAANETTPEPIESEEPKEPPLPKFIRTEFEEVFYKLKPLENGKQSKFYRTSDSQILCHLNRIFYNVGYKGHYNIDGSSYISQAVNRVCKEIYDVSKNDDVKCHIWALKVEDVVPVLEFFIRIDRARCIRQAKKFLKYWQEEVLPVLKGLPTAPKPQKSAVTAPSEPAVTFKRVFDGKILETVISEAQRFKRIGLNGTSLITAIKYVSDSQDIDLKALENFANFVQAELHETAELSARR